MKLKGKNVFLILPETPVSSLDLDINTKRELENEMLEKLTKLEVHSIGDLVNSEHEGSAKINVGDKVFVTPRALKNNPIVVDLENNVKVVLVSVYEVIGIW